MKTIRRYGRYNLKRRIKELTKEDLQQYQEIADKISYGGNPEHKKNPGDFGLTPPSGLRAGKSLCDTVSIFSRQILN